MVAHFTLRTHEGKWVFSGKNTRFDDSFDVTKCLQQIERPDLLHVCAKSNEQPSNLKTMAFIKKNLQTEINFFGTLINTNFSNMCWVSKYCKKVGVYF